jgi:hypothetical protein
MTRLERRRESLSVNDVLKFIDDLEVVILAGVLIALWIGYKRIVGQISQELHLDELRKDILRLSVLQSIHNSPYKAEVIEAEYRKYKDLGGNSYLDSEVDEWRETFEKPLVKKRLSVMGKGKGKEER